MKCYTGMVKEIPVHKAGEVVAHALVDDDFYDDLSQYRWYLHPEKYAFRIKQTKGKQQTFLMHRQVMGYGPGDPQLDHRDRNRLNNQRSNLRPSTQAENLENTSARGGSSQYRGVSWHKRQCKWQAFCSKEGKRYNLGYFSDEKEAARVALAFRQEHLRYSCD